MSINWSFLGWLFLLSALVQMFFFTSVQPMISAALGIGALAVGDIIKAIREGRSDD